MRTLSPWLARIPVACTVLVAGAGLVACTGDGTPDASAPDASNDAGPPAPTWPGTLAPTSELAPRRGRRVARAVIHLHSPLSHDACDGNGWIDGALADESCLEHLRASLCALHLDAAMLTDHAPHLDEVELSGGLWIQDGDEPVMNAAGDVVASRMLCADGHRVLVTVGSENALMPVGLDRPPGPDPTDRPSVQAAYELGGAEGVAAFHEAGAVVFQAHTEGRTVDELRPLGLDGLEVYNLHANVGPDIREEHLGLEPFGYVDQLLEFANRRFGLPPDLAVLAFLSENEPALARWDALLAEGQHLTGIGGCDAHENALPMVLTDGERADSYRRMMYWIQNHLLVDEVSPDGVEEALSAGRSYVVFEIFGTPVGFDFVATEGADTFEMGETAQLGATLTVTRPSLPDGWPSDPAPPIAMRIVRADAAGAVELATGSDETLSVPADVAGAYRVEVRITPEHARPFLGDRADALIRQLPWVYSNPIYVE